MAKSWHARQLVTGEPLGEASGSFQRAALSVAERSGLRVGEVVLRPSKSSAKRQKEAELLLERAHAANKAVLDRLSEMQRLA